MKKYFLIILSVAVLASCKDMLNTSPANQIATASMWTTESLADQGMNGLYRNFYPSSVSTSSVHINSDSFEGINRQGWMGMEFQSMNVESSGLSMLTSSSKSPSDVQINIEWRWGYTGIHRINDAIANLYKAGLDEAKYERYICEAKFLRAWYYARLNRIFQGVPIYLEPISETECTKGQSTSTEVWEVVLDDLNECIDNANFPDNTLSTNYGRPSKGAAYALRGEVYMWLAWENNEDTSYYQLAANDFQKVAECGYGLWAGNYIDFFNYNNEKDHEMIFPIQFTEDTGFCDYLQLMIAGRESYNGWSHIRPSFDFVTYYQNADGSTFDWAERIPEWNDAVFQNDIAKREVFFLRDSITYDASGTVIRDGLTWDESETAQVQERVTTLGTDLMDKYYLPYGNEDRIRSCYNDRDPRLKVTVLTPYDPYDTFCSADTNNGEVQIGIEKRWPTFDRGYGDGLDYYTGVSKEYTYLYKKYVYTGATDLIDRLHCPTDWPLIRYTDVYLHLAECYVHLGQLANAVSIVNEIRSRAGMPSVTVGSTDEVMEAVRYERRVELCAEGLDWFDEWRWGTYKDTKFQGHDVYGTTNYWGAYEGVIWTWYYRDYMYPWSAPSSEINKNSNLKRSDGWTY
ncbi:MAG: RagB/SusD family nutrient uptake outer membrane protein [Bacteroidales bacterium]|nr:RagB/SusD family nutrient uptake outer membrane protein [Bacteroidales bacterium]